ncbi:MAG TPA: type II CAAX endopeptidase family protein [Chitinophagaceae bacterium]|nr:type II CAAX endopeptidase family protein [Chitinophagaceae bacterium]
MLKQSLLNKGFGLLPVSIVAGLLFAVIRAIGTIGPQAYRFVLPVGFIVMMLMPFIFLNKEGRRRTGFVKSSSAKYYWRALIAGAGLALLCFGSGLFFFGTSHDNWFVSIKKSYLLTFDTAGMPVQQLFIIFTIPALIFSPIGEEIFFRGFLQEALASKFSYNNAMVIDSLFFAMIHLFHHGFVKDAAGVIHFYPLSGFIWMSLMFLTAIAFALLKKKSGSVYPAIISHAVFNLVMNVCIFYGPL